MSVENFNIRQYNALKKVCGCIDGKVSNLKYFVAYWRDDGGFVISVPGTEVHNWINYYWAEYKKDDEQYRITMFFKDFDHGSGNIHISPGGIQIWKKNNYCLYSKDTGFCKNDLEKCLKN